MDVATQMRPTKPEPRREAFDHLSGARSLAAFWIVCAHYLPRRSEASFNGAIFRVNAAVCFFVVASGFVTHWAYGSKDFTAWSDLLRFYVRRLGRVIATFWIALVWAAYLLYRDGADLSLPYLLRCAIFLEQWFQWCPNGPSWFVFVLLPSWILYPMTRKLLFTAEEKYGGTGLFAVLVCLWLISFGPAVVLLVLHGQITMQQHSDMSFWPPAQMADFAIGMTAAAGVRRAGAEGAWRPCRLNLLADSSCLFIVLVVLVLPRPRSTYVLHLNGWEPLLDHGLSLPIAGFLLSSCVRGAEGFCARLLAHPALVSLGEVSFEVYIFQRPMHDMVSLFLPADQMEVFMIYILSLWTFAGIYSRYFQAPLDRCLRWCSEEPGPAGHAGPAGQGRQGPPRTDVIETQEYLAVPPLQESIES